jgi:hypothetical protein
MSCYFHFYISIINCKEADGNLVYHIIMYSLLDLAFKFFQVIWRFNFGLKVIILETCIGFIVRVTSDDENIGLKQMLLYSLPKISWHSYTINASDFTFPILFTKSWITIKQTNILQKQYIFLDIESHRYALATTGEQSQAVHKRR